jgi:hypothetical protein
MIDDFQCEEAGSLSPGFWLRLQLDYERMRAGSES